MKIHIRIIVTAILFISILSLSAAESNYTNGSIEYYVDGERSNNGPGTANTYTTTTHSYISAFSMSYEGLSTSGAPASIHYQYVRLDRKVDWADVPGNVGGAFYLVENGGDYLTSPVLGTGSIYIRKGSSDGDYNLDVYFDGNCNNLELSDYDVYVYSSAIYSYYEFIYRQGSSGVLLAMYNDLKISFGPGAAQYASFGHSAAGTDYITYNYNAPFRNDYSIKVDGSLVQSTINRNVGSGLQESAYILKDSLANIVMNSGQSATNFTYYHDNGSYNYYLYTDSDNIYHLIKSNVEYSEEVTNATLSLDKNSYNIGECIDHEYTYLEELGDVGDTYILQYYAYHNLEQIRYIYSHTLTGTEPNYQGDGSTNTTGWKPSKLYYGIINSNVDYRQSTGAFLRNVKLSGFVNLTYDYEFVNDTCQGSQCSYNNGDTITIAYNTNSQRDICIRDGTDNIIQVLDTVIDSGTLTYTIPFDDSKSYSYPGWSVTMDSFNDDLLVMWIEEADYTDYVDTPIYDSEEIEDQIESVEESIQPLLDTMYGLAGIIVDNPDYDNNGIVESSELDKWFNSIISIIILLTIYIFYKGLKER